MSEHGRGSFYGTERRCRQPGRLSTASRADLLLIAPITTTRSATMHKAQEEPGCESIPEGWRGVPTHFALLGQNPASLGRLFVFLVAPDDHHMVRYNPYGSAGGKENGHVRALLGSSSRCAVQGSNRTPAAPGASASHPGLTFCWSPE